MKNTQNLDSILITKRLGLFLLFIFFLACDKDDPKPMMPEVDDLPPIVSFSNGFFIDSTGKQIFPWGYNYTNIDGVGLIEDNWLNDDAWQIISSDFDEMRSYAANIVRIHLQFNKFMRSATEANEENLQRLFELAEMAESKGLYLDITGLAAYRKSDSPAWYDEMSDEERWETQKIFWKSIAAKVGHKNAVFAFNLMNEPVVSVGCASLNDCEWLPGGSFGGFHFIQNISRDPDKTFAPTIKDWAAEMTASIRSVDPTTFVTIGFLNLGNIKQFDTSLDYVSMHIYPKRGAIQESIDFVENNLTTPLIIEETANLHCDIDDLEVFLDAIDGKYHGLLGHYSGKKLEDLDDGSIPDALKKNFIEMMIRRDPN